MRIWISGGGTGGHVYPGLTVLDASGAESGDVTWLGRADSVEQRLVERRGWSFRPIAAAAMVDRGPIGRLRGLVVIAQGTLAAWRAAGDEQPAALLITGGYVSVPVALAAWLRRIPVMIYLPDMRPGQAVRFLSRLAGRIAVTHSQAADHLPAGKIVVTGYPVRESIRKTNVTAARDRFGIESEDPVLLVFGGSQGAASINRALVDAVPGLLQRWQVLHITGPSKHAEAEVDRAALDSRLAERYHLFEYLHDADMAAALALADLALCRAGAATLGELPAARLPAILVPLPISGGHQWPNAQILVDSGAAIAVPDASLDGDRLLLEATKLNENPARLAAMQQAVASLDRPDAASAIWASLIELAGAVPA